MIENKKKPIEEMLSVLEAEKAKLLPEQRQRLAKLAVDDTTVQSDEENTSEDGENRELTPKQQDELLSTLENRFSRENKHYKQLEGVNFSEVIAALKTNPILMWSLAQMENTGGEPDIIAFEDDAFIFGDCSLESPNRRNLTYDEATEMAKKFGVDMMSPDFYSEMRRRNITLDKNSYSLLETPADIRKRDFVFRGDCRAAGLGVSLDNINASSPSGGWRGTLRVPKI